MNVFVSGVYINGCMGIYGAGWLHYHVKKQNIIMADNVNVERMHRYFGGALACAVMVYDALLATVPDY